METMLEHVGMVLMHIETGWRQCWSMWGQGENDVGVNRDKEVMVMLELVGKVLEHVGTEWEVGMMLEQTFIHV